jgi:hypothetical protein
MLGSGRRSGPDAHLSAHAIAIVRTTGKRAKIMSDSSQLMNTSSNSPEGALSKPANMIAIVSTALFTGCNLSATKPTNLINA